MIAGSGGSLSDGSVKTTSPGTRCGAIVDKQRVYSAVNHLVSEYDDLFQGLDKLRNIRVKLHIDGTVKPIALSLRRVSFHVRKQL